MTDVVIVQPYVAMYRLPFFTRLIETLAADDIRCRVAADVPRGAEGARGDHASAPWTVPYRARILSISGRNLTLGGAAGTWKGADAVVVGHLGSSLDTYHALLQGMVSRLRVGVWGHVKSYVNRPHPVDAALERWQLRRADHVFAYTPGGAEHAEAAGVPASRVTTVMNTVDTSALAQARERLSTEESDRFAEEHGIAGHPVLAYVGGIDESKRIDFLADALDELWRLDTSVRVLVGGRGRQEHLLARAAERGQAIMLGRVGPEEFAKVAAHARGFLCPGRIGLIAVDALVLGRPVISTRWPFHAPEVEYLSAGQSLFESDDDVAAFAALALEHARGSRPQADWEYPTMAAMVDNFAGGIRALLAAPAGSRRQS